MNPELEFCFVDHCEEPVTTEWVVKDKRFSRREQVLCSCAGHGHLVDEYYDVVSSSRIGGGDNVGKSIEDKSAAIYGDLDYAGYGGNPVFVSGVYAMIDVPIEHRKSTPEFDYKMSQIELIAKHNGCEAKPLRVAKGKMVGRIFWEIDWKA